MNESSLPCAVLLREELAAVRERETPCREVGLQILLLTL